MATKLGNYEAFENELHSLMKEFKDVCNLREYIYFNEFSNFSHRLNIIIDKYYKLTGVQLEKIEIYDFDHSSSGKTVRDTAIIRLKTKLESCLNLIQTHLTDLRETSLTTQLKTYEMRKCIKTNVNGCPRKPSIKRNQVFVGMPFSTDFYDAYEFGIKIALENNLNKTVYRADNNIETKDIMCKICYEMQSSEVLIFDISGSNPNVMFELGLSYGLGKETILLKDTTTKIISDLSNVEYIEYRHAKDIQDKLYKYFQ